MKQGPCKTCLWWWDLHDTGEKRCYRKESPFFHEITVKGCAMHEDSLATPRHRTKIDRYLNQRRKQDNEA